MPTSVITNTITTPQGSALANIPVRVYLAANGSVTGGFRISDGSEVASENSTVTNASGVWSMALEQNSNITPTGTYYVAVEDISENTPPEGLSRTWAFLVGSGNQTLQAALISQPPAFTPPTTPTALILAGNNTFTGTNQFDANVYFKSGSPWYDVKAFGALGDGLSDDTTAIQSALTTAAAATYGGTVFFPPGNYLTTTTLSFAANRVRLLGAGHVVTNIIGPAASLVLDIGDNVSIFHYISIEGLSITRAIAGGAGSVRMRKIDQWVIQSCSLAAGTSNLQLTACVAGHVIGNQISSHTLYGIQHDNCDQVEMTSNTFESNTAGARHIYVQSGNKAVSYTGNVFSTATYVLYADGGTSNDCSFVGNTGENLVNGLLLSPVANPASSRWSITGNTLRGTAVAGDGIRVYGSNMSIVGNKISNFTTNSIVENNGGGGVGPNTIVGNDVDIAPSLQNSATLCFGNSKGPHLLEPISNLGLGTNSFGGASQGIGIANSTTIAGSNPTGGGVIYCSSGYLVYRGSAGTVTPIATA